MVEITIRVRLNPRIRPTMSDDERKELADIIVEEMVKQLGTKLFEIEHD